MPDNSVYDNMMTRLGAAVVLTLGSDGTSYRGYLTGAHPEGEDVSDGGAATGTNDYVTLSFKLNRTKS
jgi:hypothetical protein